MNFEVIPILRIGDIVLAEDFYLEKLGCSTLWRHQRSDDMPVYMQIYREEMQLQLSQFDHHGEFGTMLFVYLKGLEQLYRELCSKGVECPNIAIADWGCPAFEIRDPFANKIVFNERPSES